jgi:hypothetical protein
MDAIFMPPEATLNAKTEEQPVTNEIAAVKASTR